jgi:hypothetical protein
MKAPITTEARLMTISSPNLAITQPLSTKQIIILALYGAVLWFLAAILVRTLGPMGALDGFGRVITYTLVIPGTVPAILIGRVLAKLRRDQTAISLIVITATALLLDGTAHAWFPALYGSDPALIVKGAAAIFWGAGVGLVLGLVMNGPKQG